MAQIESQLQSYRVPIMGQVTARFVGYVEVYANSRDEAADKVQDQIEHDTLDHDITLVEKTIGCKMSYRELEDEFNYKVEVLESAIKVNECEIDPAEVIAADVRELQRTLTWDAQKRLKYRAYLERLATRQPAAI